MCLCRPFYFHFCKFSTLPHARESEGNGLFNHEERTLALWAAMTSLLNSPIQQFPEGENGRKYITVVEHILKDLHRSNGVRRIDGRANTCTPVLSLQQLPNETASKMLKNAAAILPHVSVPPISLYVCVHVRKQITATGPQQITTFKAARTYHRPTSETDTMLRFPRCDVNQGP